MNELKKDTENLLQNKELLKQKEIGKECLVKVKRIEHYDDVFQ
jgi:hypothetical protein